ncbi:response regulator [Heyndrickxia acidicola]|uniref:histidine kinase n=1 Tax=Heyndrickxia acidicola TaxID=209389 RepID=A0ABU6MHW4_9BACI|nr:response regulator [Heyndrickxia acidicola]MED1202650.1 ATP-binding protein [Heyndrickxia acidicola]
MSFKKKQFIGFGAIMALISIMLIIILTMINHMKGSIVEIVEDRFQKVRTIVDLQQKFASTDRELLFLATDGQKSDVQTSIHLIEENDTAIKEDVDTLRKTINLKKASILLNATESKYNQYKELETSIIQAVQTKVSNSELQILVNQQSKQRISLINSINQFKNLQESQLDKSFAQSNSTYQQMLGFIFATIILCILAGILIATWVIKSTAKNLKQITHVIEAVDFDNIEALPHIEVRTEDEIGNIASAFNQMAASLKEFNQKEEEYKKEIEDKNWIQTRLAEVATMYQRIDHIETLADRFISKIVSLLDASLGSFYIKRGEGKTANFVQLASFAGQSGQAGRKKFNMGEGLMGQAAAEKQMYIIENVPEDYTVISTGLGEMKPKSIMIIPVLFEDEVAAVIEVASLQPFDALHRSLMSHVVDTLGITINSINGRMEIERLLKESQAMTEELQVQSEELQTQSEELQTQSEELQMINEQLEERTKDAEHKTFELEKVTENLEVQAMELQQSSKYKSEFLANMSHELRTPLNSILILSEMLAENSDRHLTEEDEEFARVIHSSGQDLLSLINDILDLSKVEAGKMEMLYGEMNLSELPAHIERNFAHVASDKGLELSIFKGRDVPNIFYTDEKRFRQIIKNLLSNACKFTEAGSVHVAIRKIDESSVSKWVSTTGAEYWLEVSVADTGIGISRDKQKLIFEAFQQADGATVRKYGGSGLGLSICREFARLLGGWITVDSEEGKGSIFTLYIPSLPNGMEKSAVNEEQLTQLEVAASAEVLPEPVAEMADTPEIFIETENVFKNKTVMVVDDDNRNIFALRKALNHEGMNIITANNGLECLDLLEKTDGIDIILMDIMMPDMDGYETIRRIRTDLSKRDLPIIALTAKAMKGDRDKCLEAGASDYISKPFKLEQLYSVMRVWLAK